MARRVAPRPGGEKKYNEVATTRRQRGGDRRHNEVAIGFVAKSPVFRLRGGRHVAESAHEQEFTSAEKKNLPWRPWIGSNPTKHSKEGSIAIPSQHRIPQPSRNKRNSKNAGPESFSISSEIRSSITTQKTPLMGSRNDVSLMASRVASRPGGEKNVETYLENTEL